VSRIPEGETHWLCFHARTRGAGSIWTSITKKPGVGCHSLAYSQFLPGVKDQGKDNERSKQSGTICGEVGLP